MARISYVNGAYLAHDDAGVSIEDRGYQFADGVYEYMAFYNHKLLDADLHYQRLARSLEAIQIVRPMSDRALHLVIRELIARNNKADGGVYLQVTRGVARRDHPFPANVKPALTLTICSAKTPKTLEVTNGVAAITHPDMRWARKDIKSISLLANVLAKQEAARQKMREAWLFTPDGYITEGSVSNAYIVNAADEIITHPADWQILGGVTRDVVLRLARKAGFVVQEAPFTLAQCVDAKEAFITSTSANVLPVVTIDGKKIGDGTVGKVTRALMIAYHDYIFNQTGKRF